MCRFFCLTSSGLTYSKSKSDSVLCNILTEDMLAVERVDEDAFTMKHVGVMKWVWLTLITALIPNYCPIRAGIVCRNSEVDKVNKHIHNMHTHTVSQIFPLIMNEVTSNGILKEHYLVMQYTYLNFTTL